MRLAMVLDIVERDLEEQKKVRWNCAQGVLSRTVYGNKHHKVSHLLHHVEGIEEVDMQVSNLGLVIKKMTVLLHDGTRIERWCVQR